MLNEINSLGRRSTSHRNWGLHKEGKRIGIGINKGKYKAHFFFLKYFKVYKKIYKVYNK